MAKGDIIWFEQAYVDTDKALHDKDGGSFTLALATGVVTPLPTTPDPRWGAGGGTDLSANEVAPGGNYPAGGIPIVNNTVTLVANESEFDADDVTVAQDPLNPTDARWAYIRNTALGDRVLGAVDLGADTDLSAGPFELIWNVAGITTTGAAAP